MKAAHRRRSMQLLTPDPQSQRCHSSLGSYEDCNRVESGSTSFLDNIGFNVLVSGITEQLENGMEFKGAKEKRSCSVSSYLLSPNLVFPLSPSVPSSPFPSPRNLSLPVNKFFPSNLNIPSSRKTSGSSIDGFVSSSPDRRPSFSSRPSSPRYGSRSPSPCITPRHRSCRSAYSSPSTRRQKKRTSSVSEGSKSNMYDDNESILHSLGLNPKLYQDLDNEEEEKFPDNHLGRIFYNIRYDAIKETLSLRIINVKNLPSNNKEIGKIYKSYLSVCLLPDERSERRAYQAVNSFSDHNPVFNESFFFQVSPQSIRDRVIKMKIYNIDVNRKHRIIGQVLCSLGEMDWSRNTKYEMATDISKYTRSSMDTNSSEVLLSVGYNPTISRLTVNVLQGKDLRKRCRGNLDQDSPNTFAKVLLGRHTKVVKVKKTSTVKNSSFPEYSESFHFPLSEEDLDRTSLTVTIFEEMGLLEKNRAIGSCVLGGFMFARGKGEEHWNQVKKLKKQQIEMWHTLVIKNQKNQRCLNGSVLLHNIEQESKSCSRF